LKNSIEDVALIMLHALTCGAVANPGTVSLDTYKTTAQAIEFAKEFQKQIDKENA
jgi:hypothetical protein